VCPPATASGTEDALVAAEIVRTYYVFGGVSPTAEQMASGLPVAIELLQSGHSRRDLEAILVRIVRETDLWKEQPFAVAMLSWMASHGSIEDGEPAAEHVEAAVPEVVPDEPAVAEPDVEEEHWARAPPAEIQTDAPVDVPREEPAPDAPADVLQEGPAAETLAATTSEPSDPVDSDEPQQVPTVSPERVRAPPPEQSWRRFETGLIVTGSVLLGVGMIGGAISGGVYSSAANYNPGYTPAIGAIPFVGPGAVHNYWNVFAGDQALELKYYVGVAAGLTAVEIAGASLLIVGIASHVSNRRSRATSARRIEDLMVVPTISPAGSYLAVAGRF